MVLALFKNIVRRRAMVVGVRQGCREERYLWFFPADAQLAQYVGTARGAS